MQNAPTPEYVLELAERLVEAKQQVASLEKQWADLFGSVVHVAESTPKLKLGEPAADDEGITARFLQFLERYKPEPFTVQQIALGIGAEPSQVHRVIHRMLPKGKIKRAERGTYMSASSEVANAA